MFSTTSESQIEELQRLLAQTDPAVLLVWPRILRRVIRHDRELHHAGLRIPHSQGYEVDRATLFRIVEPEELDVSSPHTLPEQIFLLPMPKQRGKFPSVGRSLWSSLRELIFPAPDELRGSSSSAEQDGRAREKLSGSLLLDSWRQLFHLRIHAALRHQRISGQLTEPEVRHRIACIGLTAFLEARRVLETRNDLFHPDNLVEVYEEFVASYLELRYFDPERLPFTFPALFHYGTGTAATGVTGESVDSVVLTNLDADAIFAATRIRGANPVQPPISATLPDEDDEEERSPLQPNEGKYRQLITQADSARGKGNNVRAALLLQQAAALAPHGQRRASRLQARAEIETLCDRLRAALELSEEELNDWRACMLHLLEPAAQPRGGLPRWNRTARQLYDIQKICVDRERAIYAVDLVECLASWGKKPIKRLLPHQGLILQLGHLRRVLRRVRRLRISATIAQRLRDCCTRGLHRTEHQVREIYRPRIEQAFATLKLAPRNYPERLARNKLIEELLDQVVEEGYLTLGQVRDAIARNQLKLPDLSNPVEFLGGDPLILANWNLAQELDGVYRRGEVYLRWLQRFSSLGFGTRVGRFLTRYLVLPFGGAYFVLEGLQHLLHWPLKLMGVSHIHLNNWFAWAAPQGSPWTGWTGQLTTIGLVGLFFLGLMHLPLFRRYVVDGLWWSWRAIRGLCYDFPVWLAQLPVLQRIVKSRPFQLFYRFLFKPLIWGALIFFLCYLFGFPHSTSVFASVVAYVVTTIMLNTRFGMLVEEICTDELIRFWDLLRLDILPGLLRWIIDLFRWLTDRVQRFLYTVDEWLRFRSGEGTFALVGKVILGVIWWLIAYVIRFAIYLLIEPQINPVKHFPVVTVSHKLLLATVPPVASAMASGFGISVAEATLIYGSIVWAIPGVFGFLAWELKENWRLYRATRPSELKPVVVGSHGETVRALLKPGFHSGTLPKLFGSLRRSESVSINKYQNQLEEVRTHVRCFIERELLAFLRDSQGWAHIPLPTIQEIGLGTNRISVELGCPEQGTSILLNLEHQDGLVLVGLRARTPDQWTSNWLARLDQDHRNTLHDALVGLYKKAGVDLVRPQIEAVLAPLVRSDCLYEVKRQGILLWGAVTNGHEERVFLEYDPEESHTSEVPVPNWSAENVLFKRWPVTWTEWVAVWERDQAGKGHHPPLLAELQLLPLREAVGCRL